MSTGTLLSISISNFGPFANPTTFSTVSDIAKKELIEENTFEIRETKYNTVSYIYGANGAGKSNFCKALLQLQTFLSISPLLASNNPQLLELSPLKAVRSTSLENPFKFDSSFSEKPTTFNIELLLDGITYNYCFSAFNGKIVAEKLTKKNRRTEIILDRTSPAYNDIILKSELKDFEGNLAVVKENVLCLSMAAFLNVNLAVNLINTIQSIDVVNMANHRFPNITEEACTPERIKKYLKVLRNADPTLQDLHINFNEEKVERQKMNVPDLEGKELVISSVQVDIVSTHSIYNGDEIVGSCELPFVQIESSGTIKLFGLLPYIFDKIENGGVLVVDEIENGMHPNIVKEIINLFNDKSENPLNAQLICTSHSKELIENNVRRDQIWIVSKNGKGISDLTRVSELPGMRAYEKSGQKYLEKAFGKFPLELFRN